MSRVKMIATQGPLDTKPPAALFKSLAGSLEIPKRDYISLCTVLGLLDTVMRAHDLVPNKALIAEAHKQLLDTMYFFTYAMDEGAS